jgi:hypothetical protein
MQRIVDLSSALKGPNRAGRRHARTFQRERERGVVLWAAFVFDGVGCIGFGVTEHPDTLLALMTDQVEHARRRGELPAGLGASVVPLAFSPGCPLEQLVAVLGLPRDTIHTAEQLQAAGVWLTEMSPDTLARLHPLASTSAPTTSQQ